MSDLKTAFLADVKALGSEFERPILLALKNWASNSEDHYDLVVDLHDLGARNLAGVVEASYATLLDLSALEIKELVKAHSPQKKARDEIKTKSK